MELMEKQGYKETEVGLIPEDWGIKSLDDFCELTSSKRIFAHDYVSNGIPFYRGKEISLLLENKPINEPYFITEDKYESLSNKFGAPKENDILITAVGTLGNVYLVPNNNKFYFKDGNLIWLRKTKGIDSLYLSIQLYNHKKQIIDNAIGSSQKALTIVVLKKQLIPIPPTLTEQKAIATALSDVDALITSLEQTITKKKAIKQGAMQSLLTGKKRIKGFEKSNYVSSSYGNIPSDWKITNLGSVANIFGRIGFRGYTVKDLVEEGHGALSLSPSNIIENKIDFTKKTFISWFKYEESPEIKLQHGDIVLVKTASIGKTALIKDMPFKITLNPQVVVFKNFKMDNVLLSYIIQNPIIQSQIKSFVVGGVVPTLSQEQIKSFSFPCPQSIKEQQAIAQILSDMDAEITQLENKKEKYQAVKQGMMQELLTGKTRLV